MNRSALPFLFLCAALQVACGEDATEFEKEKAKHKTVLRKRDKVPEDYNQFLPAPGTRVVLYPSGDLKLRAWYRLPPDAAGRKVPAVVYFHGGFALSPEDLAQSQAFVDAGFAVLAPTLRGENGNPGTFELFLGEADDGLAAVRWLAAQPEVDGTRVYTFGHSAGGAISALLSLYREPALRLTGSSGGLYTEEFFRALQREDLSKMPFDPADEKEVRLRLLAKNTARMQRMHVAVIGKQDAPMLKLGRDVQRVVAENKAPLKFSVVEGDHASSLPAAIQLFITLLRKDLEQP